MWELYRKYVTPLYLVIMVCFILYGLWYRDAVGNPVALLGMIYPCVAAAAGVLVYIFTGHDWVQVDLYAVYMLAGYFAVTWLGIGARRVYHNAMEGTEKKK